jgi:hypothetical protein
LPTDVQVVTKTCRQWGRHPARFDANSCAELVIEDLVMIMKRIDSDDHDSFEVGPDFFADTTTASSPVSYDSRTVGYMYRGVPQDRNAKRLRLDRGQSRLVIAAPKWLTMSVAVESISTELFFG